MDIENIEVLNIILYDNSEGGLCIWSSQGVVVYGRARVVIKGYFLMDI